MICFSFDLTACELSTDVLQSILFRKLLYNTEYCILYNTEGFHFIHFIICEDTFINSLLTLEFRG